LTWFSIRIEVSGRNRFSPLKAPAEEMAAPYGLLSKKTATVTYFLLGSMLPEVGCDEAVRANQSDPHPRFACAQAWSVCESTQDGMWKWWPWAHRRKVEGANTLRPRFHSCAALRWPAHCPSSISCLRRTHAELLEPLRAI